jgi:hypothetical protein
MSIGPTVSTIKWQKVLEENEPQQSDGDLMTDFVHKLYTSSYNTVALSGTCDPSYLNRVSLFRHITCEYCGTTANVSCDINVCESCDAPYGIIDFIINVCKASTMTTSYGDDEYTMLAKKTLISIFNIVPYFNKRETELYPVVQYLTKESTIKIVDLLIGFIKPDMLVNNK